MTNTLWQLLEWVQFSNLLGKNQKNSALVQKIMEN